MPIEYKELKSITIELAKLTEENKKIGVTSTPLKLTPAFIMPNNTIYYMTTDHYSANFYEEIEMSLNAIDKNNSFSLEKIGIKENLLLLRNNLLKDYQRFLNKDILAGDVRYYLNMNCLEFFKYNPHLKNIYSSDTRNVLTMLLNSKIQIYDYFLKLAEDCNDIIQILKNHPLAPSEINTENLIKNAKMMIEVNDRPEDNIMLNRIIENLLDLSKNELLSLTKEDFIQDFAVLSIGIDKIETQVNKTITTTKQNPYEFYFNYLIMGYNIAQLSKIIFNNQKQVFKTINKNEYSIISHYDDKYKEEANLILKKVPYSERYKYFI